MTRHLQDDFIEGNLDERRKLIAEICASSPMFGVVVRKARERRLEDRNGHWLADFATQDYLGLDFDPAVVEAAVAGTREYGTVVPWCRLVAINEVYLEVEEAVAGLIGAEAVNIFASTTLLNHGVIPALLGKDGVFFLDKSGHATMYEGAKIARDSGAKLVPFPTGDVEELDRLLGEHSEAKKKLIAVDGVYSMTGDYPDLPAMDAVAKKHRALLFVDDAHGFGVVGEQPSAEHPYGRRGNGIVRYFGLGYENILYVGCFSKSYGSFGAFIGCTRRMWDFLLSQATPHDLGGAGPASAMSAVRAGLVRNEEKGDALRRRIHGLAARAIGGLRGLGFTVNNTTGFPILSVWLGDSEHLIATSKILYENHILLTLSPYPMVRRGNEAFRITVTATNTEEEIDQLIGAFAEVKRYLDREGVPYRRG
jgi:8-amino-7-oxononanoate synthase